MAVFNSYHDQPAEWRNALEGLDGLRAGIAQLEAVVAGPSAAPDEFEAELLSLNASWHICRIAGLAP